METPVRPIHTEEDYDAALMLADTLMSAEPGTLESDRLETLVTSIEAYEAREWPVDPPPPQYG